MIKRIKLRHAIKDLIQTGRPSAFLNIFILLAAIAILFLYLRGGSKESEDTLEVLAEVNGVKIHRLSLNREAQAKLHALEVESYEVLSDAVDRSIDETIIAREAAAESLSSDALLEREVLSKVSVTPKQVYDHYARSPAAENLPYENALKEIRKDLERLQRQRILNKYLSRLYRNYRIRRFVKAPPMYSKGSEKAEFKFPLYVGPETAKPDVVRGEAKHPPFLGPTEAPVLIEVFSDFRCFRSARFAPLVTRIAKEYPDEVRLEFRHSPSPRRPKSKYTHEISVCAQEQGIFWEYHDELFKATASGGRQPHLYISRDLAMDMHRFKSCMKSRKYGKFIDKEIAETEKRGVLNTPTWFVNGRYRTSVPSYEELKALVDWSLQPEGPAPGAKPRQPSQDLAALNPAERQETFYSFTEDDLKDSPSLGPKEAPITLIEFIDFNCGFCRRVLPTVDQILENFGPQIRYVSKQFPLRNRSFPSAMASLCAHEQGQFWEYRRKLLTETSRDISNMEDLRAIAKDLGLNKDAFDLCLEEKHSEKRVNDDKNLGRIIGVRGTPAFFLNGTLMSGARPYEYFEQRINEELAGQ